MPDTLTKRQRSMLMSRVKSAGNQSTELALASALRRQKISGWRRHLPMPGKPDFAFPHSNLAVFVDGCFWHGCKLHGSLPATNKSYWKEKFISNKARDKRVSRLLRGQGWKVLRIWEHEVKCSPKKCARKVASVLKRD
jgi:DNA mismatch endonuclease (patch repair protein)